MFLAKAGSSVFQQVTSVAVSLNEMSLASQYAAPAVGRWPHLVIPWLPSALMDKNNMAARNATVQLYMYDPESNSKQEEEEVPAAVSI